MTRPEIGIGVVGYGMMGRAHSYAYTAAPVLRPLGCRPRLRVISGREPHRVGRAAAAYGFDGWVTDSRDAVSRRDEIAPAAVWPGRSVIGEKPLAVTYDQGASAAGAVRRAGVLNAVGFNYR